MSAVILRVCRKRGLESLLPSTASILSGDLALSVVICGVYRRGAMSKCEESWVKGRWAVAWCSVVYLPLMIAIFSLLFAHIVGLVFLPVFAVSCAWLRAWGYGAAACASWIVVYWSWRRLRLAEHLNTPWNSR